MKLILNYIIPAATIAAVLWVCIYTTMVVIADTAEKYQTTIGGK